MSMLAGLLLCGSPAAAYESQGKFNLIPQPLSVRESEGSYTFRQFTVAYEPGNEELAEIADLFGQKVIPPTGLPFETTTSPKKANVVFALTADTTLGDEGYRLSVTPQGATISARKPAGVFYGVQTLLQLFPEQIKSPERVDGTAWTVPAIEISDRPRFAWRVMMLDVSRLWFTKEEVKRFIDEMAEYKMNRFHWHLTDDQGWRIQIDALPRLTEVGAWRAPRVGDWWSRDPQRPGEATTYGGFYTKADIAEVVEYARRRYVTIMPEVDVPGHSLAALVAYPELACLDAPEAVNVGNKFYGTDENSLCIGGPKTMEYMEKIFAEVAEMFPGEYIHVGGDECFKGFWQKCPKCTKLMKDKGLKDVNELQSWFIHEMEGILKAKGKKLVGWDEIHEGGLSPEATVMSWRGMKGGILAAEQGHHVIMTPDNHCYIDLYQGEPTVEPNTYSMCRLTDAYNWDPVPAGIDSSWIVGGQANLWAESVPTFRHAEYMAWPRGWALAEVFWTDTLRNDWAGFVKRTEHHFRRADRADVNHSRSMYNAIVTTEADSLGALRVSLAAEVPGLDIYYSFDNTIPDLHGLKYTDPVVVPLNASRITVATYRGKEPVGALIRLDVKELKARAVKTERVIGNL